MGDINFSESFGYDLIESVSKLQDKALQIADDCHGCDSNICTRTIIPHTGPAVKPQSDSLKELN